MTVQDTISSLDGNPNIPRPPGKGQDAWARTRRGGDAYAPSIAVPLDVDREPENDGVMPTIWGPIRPVAVPIGKPERKPLDEIAALVRALTYGEMIELAEAIWSVKPGEELTEASLPMTLHLWSADNG